MQVVCQARVRRGATVLIVDRGRPVARLEPIGTGPGSGGRLAQLVRDGLARPPRGRCLQTCSIRRRALAPAASPRWRRCSRSGCPAGEIWDSSAVVSLLVAEPGTRSTQTLLREDQGIVVWWATPAECASAIARLEREGALDEDAAVRALDRLSRLASAWHEIDATELLRETAVRCLRLHPLRAADAPQLAAAIVAAQGPPSTLDVVTRDERLAAALRREGFRVIGPSL